MSEIPLRIFVKEDISKPENRINLAIFHLQMFDEFHHWFLSKLKLNIDSLIFPVKNENGSRPDFIIMNSSGDKVGYIEVECGIDREQLNKFKKLYEKDGIKVYSIFGKKEYLSDLSLEEIKIYLDSIYDTIQSNQIKISCKYLTNLIDTTIYNINDTSRKPVNQDFINSNLFIKELLSKLKEVDKVKDATRPAPGYIYYDTIKPEGFSLKVYSPKGTKKHIALLSISAGRPTITFQPEFKYRSYLYHKDVAIVNSWIKFICDELKYPIGSGKRADVPIKTVHNNIDALTELIKHLA